MDGITTADSGAGTGEMADERARAAAWFADLQDRITAAFEALEDSQAPNASAPHLADRAPGRFDRSQTRRASDDGSDGGGGTMAVMRGGRVFEKVGVNVSAVYGTLGAMAQRSLTARKELPGLAEDPRFWASGISLVAHLNSPKIPAVHMNTRMFWTASGWWFGGGTDLNPMREVAEDTAFFHGVLDAACAPHGADLYPRYKAWADEYDRKRTRLNSRHPVESAGRGGGWRGG
ncbi:MAG: coproporphyrinogen III oxidase, partial [Pseudomonadota bacterium]